MFLYYVKNICGGEEIGAMGFNKFVGNFQSIFLTELNVFNVVVQI